MRRAPPTTCRSPRVSVRDHQRDCGLCSYSTLTAMTTRSASTSSTTRSAPPSSTTATRSSPSAGGRVTAEHFAFCPDNIWQSNTDTFRTYAESVMGVNCWSFWWD
ncbi:DUF4253 domain-containing protein [Micromonospora sp. NPDC049359]|uniref:DUF4253 domain-containing protein n=1 Tax=Micromonospora sp. NPDC049359 TaxID=3364270 RepID=UPI0037A0A4BD